MGSTLGLEVNGPSTLSETEAAGFRQYCIMRCLLSECGHKGPYPKPGFFFSALGKLKQENHEVEANLGYIVRYKSLCGKMVRSSLFSESHARKRAQLAALQ